MPAAPRRLRVVLDTNVLFSALGFRGPVARIWALAEEDRFDLFVSSFIMEELARNLLEKTDLGPKRVGVLLEGVALPARLVEPAARLEVIRRKDSDNRILECAVAAKADVLVTGGLRDIRSLGSFQGFEILTPREFLDKHFPSIA